MRKTDAGVRARIESNRDKVPVELWSRAPQRNGIPIPRIARTWVLLNPSRENDKDVPARQAELQERGFRHERTVDLSDWDGGGES